MLALCLGDVGGTSGSVRVACVIVARRSPLPRAVVLEGLNQWEERGGCKALLA